MWLGTALHILSQDRLILRVGGPFPQPKKLEELISMTIVVDENMNEHGTIMEIFGPVENPYVVVQLKDAQGDAESLLGQKFYHIKRGKAGDSRNKA